MKIIIRYGEHCGYLVETPTWQWVFDWIKQPLPSLDKKTINFITHSHDDHFDRAILNQSFDYRVVSKDCEVAASKRVKVVEVGDVLTIDEVKITVLGSTDLGVSYLVESPETTLFYGGDLNDWHWEKESTCEEIKEMQEWFLWLIQPLKGKKVDFLFFDIDPRLEVDYDRGLRQLLEIFEAKVIFPMHFSWNKEEIETYYLQSAIDNLIEVKEINSVFEFELEVDDEKETTETNQNS